jgi:hypothetical protein
MFISPQLFQMASPGQQPVRSMATTHIMLDDNFVLGKRRRDSKDDGLAVVSHSSWESPSAINLTQLITPSSHKNKSPMTIKTTGLRRDTSGSSLPSPPLDHQDFGHAVHTSSNRMAAPTRRSDTPPPLKNRRKVIPIKKSHTAVTIHLPPTTHQAGQLAPCHLCSSKPRQKTDLERYTDCQLCEKRTCAICIRICHGSCGDRRICRECSKEQGEEGDSHCLDCLQDKTEDHEMED